jgi:hypothetical protein
VPAAPHEPCAEPAHAHDANVSHQPALPATADLLKDNERRLQRWEERLAFLRELRTLLGDAEREGQC